VACFFLARGVDSVDMMAQMVLCAKIKKSPKTVQYYFKNIYAKFINVNENEKQRMIVV